MTKPSMTLIWRDWDIRIRSRRRWRREDVEAIFSAALEKEFLGKRILHTERLGSKIQKI